MTTIHDEEKVKGGYILKSNQGNYVLVLKVVGNAFVQDAFNGNWSNQSRNENKTVIVYIWDGKFMQKRSIEEVANYYSEILKPSEIDFLSIMETINNYGK